MHKNHAILKKLSSRLTTDEVTTAYQLKKFNIYYYNKKDESKKYDKAILVMFGLKQYHKNPPPRETIIKIIDILKNISNIDLCLDIMREPNYRELKAYFYLNQFVTSKGFKTNTHYINETNRTMMEKVVLYDKQVKNDLNFKVWRIEAKIIIPNSKALFLPLSEFKEITQIARILQND